MVRMTGEDMKQSRQPNIQLETQLGLLAMRFRSTRDESESDKVAAQYAHVVERLIASRERKGSKVNLRYIGALMCASPISDRNAFSRP